MINEKPPLEPIYIGVIEFGKKSGSHKAVACEENNDRLLGMIEIFYNAKWTVPGLSSVASRILVHAKRRRYYCA